MKRKGKTEESMLHAERVIFTAARNRYFLLPHQESNLNSSDPESDVLPITPWGKGKNPVIFANFRFAMAAH
jgi:hypothetical protein